MNPAVTAATDLICLFCRTADSSWLQPSRNYEYLVFERMFNMSTQLSGRSWRPK